MWMIRGPPMAPDRLSELYDSHVQQLEVLRTMSGACGPYNSGGSATLTRLKRFISRYLQAICVISFYFCLYLLLYVCAARFDVMENFENLLFFE